MFSHETVILHCQLSPRPVEGEVNKINTYFLRCDPHHAHKLQIVQQQALRQPPQLQRPVEAALLLLPVL